MAIVFGFNSCKKNRGEAVTPYVPDKTFQLTEGGIETFEDTLYIKRSATSMKVRISALTNQPNKFKRLYAFKRSFDGTTMSAYVTTAISGFVQDGTGNYYKDISTAGDTSETVEMTIVPNTSNEITYEDYYFVFTDGDFSDPNSPTNVVIGPVLLNVQNGLLTEYTAMKMYNYFCIETYTPVINLYNATAYVVDTPDSNKYLMDMDSVTTTFERMFTSKNGTQFIKAPSNFKYLKATDYMVRKTFEDNSGSAFTTSPSAVNVGDVFIAKLKGVSTTNFSDYAVIRCTSYFDDGLTGTNKNNDFIQWSIKK
jgi:hypothetical protein